MDLYRCASHLRSTDPLVDEFMAAYGPWRQHGIMPAPGGSFDQSRAWVRLQGLADAEISKLKEAESRTPREAAAAKSRRSRLVPGSS